MKIRAPSSNHFSHDGFALPRFCQIVYQPELVHLLRCKDSPRCDQILGKVGANLPRQNAVCTHTGKQVKQHLGEAHFDAPLGDNYVVRQRQFEPAAQ